MLGLGFPIAILLVSETRYYLGRLILASAVVSGLLLYTIFMAGSIFGIITYDYLLPAFVLSFLTPFLFKKTRSNAKRLLASFSVSTKLHFFELLILGIIIFVLAITFIVAIQSTPIFDDPLAVWLFLGKKIYLTGKIPLYFGNAADISESGNYPPMPSFLAASVFFLFHAINASSYTLIPWYYGSLGVLAIALLVKELGGCTESALLAGLLALFVSIYSLEMFGWGYTDTLDSFYVIAFLYFALSKTGSALENTRLCLFALTDGIVSKYNVLLILVPSVLIFLAARGEIIRASNLKNFRILILVSFCLLVMCSWFVRNWVLLHDPVYPFLYNIFKAKAIDPPIKNLVPPTSFPLPPFSPTFILQDRTYTGLTNEGDLWPVLAFGAGSITYFLFKRDRTMQLFSLWALLSFAIIFAFWEYIGGYERYFLLIIPALAVLSGMFFDRIIPKVSNERRCFRILKHVTTDKQSFKARISQVFFIVCVVIISFSTLTAIITAEPTVPNSAYIQSWDYLNNLPHGVVATNDIRFFYANQPVISFYNIPAFFNASSVEGAFSALRNSNVTYIYFDSRFDYGVYLDHTYLIQLLLDNTLVTKLALFQLGTNENSTIYRLNQNVST